MGKKLLIIMLAAVMMLGIFGLTACNPKDELAEYKSTKKTEIETYAQEHIDNYGEGTGR